MSLGPFPFAIGPPTSSSAAERYAIAMAGFVAQDLYSETIRSLIPTCASTTGPLLRACWRCTRFDHRLCHHRLCGRRTAAERCQHAVARLSLPPWAVGLILISPAICDTYRYFVPGSRWAPWVSISGKLTLLGGVLTF